MQNVSDIMIRKYGTDFNCEINIFRGTGRKGKNMSECVREMEVAPLTLEQFEVLNKKNYMLEEENRKLKSDVRELQQVI